MQIRSLAALGGLAALALSVVAGVGMAQPPGAGSNGQSLFQGRCATCHESGEDRAPDRAALGRMSPTDIIAALNGVMAPMTEGMTAGDKQAIATFLTTPAQAAGAPGGRGGGRGGAPGAPGAQAGRGGAPGGAPAGGRGGAVQTTDTVCTANPPITPSNSDWLGAGGTLTGHRYQPNPGIRAADVPRLKVKWAFSITQGNGQPTVIGDWLWVSGSGRLYALDPASGCVRWRTDGVASRTTPMIVRSTTSPSGWLLVIGLRNRTVKAYDALNGREIWTSPVLETHSASGITGSIIVTDRQVFVPLTSGEEARGATPTYACCSFRGSLAALDLTTGRKQWQVYPVSEPMRPIRVTPAGATLQGPAGGAIWSQPTVDTRRGLVYVATGDSYTEADTKGTDAIIAYEMATGRVKWSTQVTSGDNFVMNCTVANIPANCPTPLGPDYDFGASPILFNAPGGRQILLSGQKSGLVHGMNPDTGEHLWATRIGGGGALGGIEWGISADTQRLYAGSSDIVSVFDEYARPLGKSTRPNPPEPADPALAAIDPVTGRILWRVETPKVDCNVKSARSNNQCAAGNSASPASMPGVVFAGSTDGWFRAYNSANGRIVWQHNTAGQTYRTVNGVAAQPGGGVDGNGPTIAHGTVFTTSGFSGASGYGSTPTGTNVLLAYTVDGR